MALSGRTPFRHTLASNWKFEESFVPLAIKHDSFLVDGSVVKLDHLAALDRVEAVGAAPGEHERAALDVSAREPEGLRGSGAEHVAAHQFALVAVTPNKLSRLSRIDAVDDRGEIVAPHPRRHDDKRQKCEKTDWFKFDDLHCFE